MVFFFTSSTGHTIYMGRDKYENEDLIKYGLIEDIWFHVDDLSSAHVYLRLNPGERLEDVPPELVMECAQLVKANSIEGCKLNHVDVVYTRWRNLHKTASMDVGAIGFHDPTKVKKLRVTKDNSIVNRLNKTKEERNPDLEELQQQRAAEIRAAAKEEKRQQFNAEKTMRKEKEEAAKLKSYSTLMKPEKMHTLEKYGSSTDDSAAKRAEEDFF